MSTWDKIITDSNKITDLTAPTSTVDINRNIVKNVTALESAADTDIIIDHGADKDIILKQNGTIAGSIGSFNGAGTTYGCIFHLGGDESSNFDVYLSQDTAGATLGTIDSGGITNHFELDAMGDITLDAASSVILDSNTGEIFLKDGGGEYVPSSDESATTVKWVEHEAPGAIIGFTSITHTAPDSQTTTSLLAPINWNFDSGLGAQDHYLGVSFVVPISKNILIEAFLPACSACDGNLQLGLMTQSLGTFTTIDADITSKVWDVDESDFVQVRQTWVIDADDHSWAAGDTIVLYIGMLEQFSGGRVYIGQNTFGPNYGTAQCKATALPTSISQGLAI